MLNYFAVQIFIKNPNVPVFFVIVKKRFMQRLWPYNQFYDIVTKARIKVQGYSPIMSSLSENV